MLFSLPEGGPDKGRVQNGLLLQSLGDLVRQKESLKGVR